MVCGSPQSIPLSFNRIVLEILLAVYNFIDITSDL